MPSIRLLCLCDLRLRSDFPFFISISAEMLHAMHLSCASFAHLNLLCDGGLSYNNTFSFRWNEIKWNEEENMRRDIHLETWTPSVWMCIFQAIENGINDCPVRYYFQSKAQMLYCVVLSLLRCESRKNKFYTRKNKQTNKRCQFSRNIYVCIYAERNLSDNGCHKIQKEKIDWVV